MVCAHDLCMYMYLLIVLSLNSVRSVTFPETKITSNERFVISSRSLLVELDGRFFLN